VINRIKNIGPGALVAAAFIGPGTITTCTLAGAKYGYALLWALVFATFATIVLQEMSARLGTITCRGLGEILHQMLQDSLWKWPLNLLIIVAIYIGNTAYEAGNLSGSALGITAVLGNGQFVYVVAVGLTSLIAALLIWFGSYRQIERILLGLVVMMAAAFIATFIITRPDVSSLLRGLIVQIPADSLITVIALIGTTVVPYNLFLHASAAKSRWSGEKDLGDARIDTAFSIGLGGIVTLLVVSTAAASLFGTGISVSGVGDMAKQLEPVFGAFSKYLLGFGMFAAGLSSAIAAPLATAYVMSEITGIGHDKTSYQFRVVGLSVIAVGAGLALTGINPITIIISAQFANGLLLPIVAGFLLIAMNRKDLLSGHTNGWFANALGGSVVLITAGLGVRLIARALGFY